MQNRIDRIARSTPIWVSPIVLLGIVTPPALILAALIGGEWRTALLITLAVGLSNWGSGLARKYYDPHR